VLPKRQGSSGLIASTNEHSFVRPGKEIANPVPCVHYPALNNCFLQLQFSQESGLSCFLCAQTQLPLIFISHCSLDGHSASWQSLPFLLSTKQSTAATPRRRAFPVSESCSRGTLTSI